MWYPSGPPKSNGDDSNIQEVSERDPQTQVMTTNTSDRVQNQSSRQALMASIRARRSFIESTDLSSDMNPDSAVVIEDTLVKLAQALDRVTNIDPSETCSGDQDNLDETSVYEDSYTLEFWQDDTEYMVPSRENTKFRQSTLEIKNSELNMTQMIMT